MNKLFKAFLIGIGIITHQLHSISLTDYIQQHGMPEVVEGRLDLENRNLTNLIGLQDIPNIGQVNWIDLSNNKIKTLPDTIFNGLHNLQYLFLNDNKIKTLPSNIFNDLHNLSMLDFSYNQIKTLPNTIFNGLHNLDRLELHHNQIQTLPDTIFNGLQSLKFLRLQGNHFTLDFIPTLTDLLLNIPKLVEINDMPKNEALNKPPFGTLKKLAATNIVQNLDRYWPNLHTLPTDILDLLPLTEQQRQEIAKRHEIEEQREKLEKEKHEIEKRRAILSCSLV